MLNTFLLDLIPDYVLKRDSCCRITKTIGLMCQSEDKSRWLLPREAAKDTASNFARASPVLTSTKGRREIPH
jgi:hypothetical protein